MEIRKIFVRSSAVASLIVLFAGGASAQHQLDMVSFLAGGGGLNVEAFGEGQHESGRFGVGAFKWSLDAGPVIENSPLYCLDVFHSFSFQQKPWEVDVIPIPPDPHHGCAPFNTDQVAWVYHTYGSWNRLSELSATARYYRSQGVQLALWEISHDRAWYQEWEEGNWWEHGNFRYHDSTIQGMGTGYRAWADANAILDDLYAAVSAGPLFLERNCYWYEPRGYPAQTFGQGQVGDGDNLIPEPGTFTLLGLGLAAAACAAWRKRRV